jgi:hypothetical protein
MLWFIPPIVSALAWVGIDLGLSFLMDDKTTVSFAPGMDSGMFFSEYWFFLLIIFGWTLLMILIANPKRNTTKGGERSGNGR